MQKIDVHRPAIGKVPAQTDRELLGRRGAQPGIDGDRDTWIRVAEHRYRRRFVDAMSGRRPGAERTGRGQHERPDAIGAVDEPADPVDGGNDVVVEDTIRAVDGGAPGTWPGPDRADAWS